MTKARVIQQNLDRIRTSITESEHLGKVLGAFYNKARLRDIYQSLQSSGQSRTAKKLLVHSESMVEHHRALEEALREAEFIILRQAEHYGKADTT